MPGNAGEAGAQADARLLGDQHHIGRTAAERFRPAAGDRRRAHADPVVARPADPGDHPARTAAATGTTAASRSTAGRGCRSTHSTISALMCSATWNGGTVTTVVAAPVAVHQIRLAGPAHRTGGNSP